MPDLPFLTPLAAEQIAASGLDGRWSYALADRVRFHEIDALGHVNNVAYLRWFEALRVQYFVDWGMTSYGANDAQVVMKSQSIGYHAPMFLHEDYLVACRTRSFRATSFVMEYACHSNGLRATSESVMVLLEPDGRTKRALPEALRARFRSVDGARAD